MSPFVEVTRQLAMSWGVYPDLPTAGSYGYTVSEDGMFDYENPIVEKATDDLDLVLRNACRSALKKGLVADPDDLLVVTAGLPFGTPGGTLHYIRFSIRRTSSVYDLFVSIFSTMVLYSFMIPP